MNNLLEIWKDQPSGYLAVSSKTGSNWKDYFFTKLPDVLKWVSDNRNDSDLYFCITTLKNPKRVKENVQPSRYLWQDLDESDPRKLPENLKPSIAWESSSDRFQAIWKLNTLYSAEDIEKLNQKLAAAVKADRGSWILTKVLRIPGTKNFKYASKPEVKLLWLDGPEYTYKELERTALAGRREAVDSSEITNLIDSTNAGHPKTILSKYWKKLNRKVQELLISKTEPPVGGRSDTLWYMEHELIKAGATLPEVKAVIQNSVWNKYKGRRDEEERLTEEITKVFGEEIEVEEEKPKSKTKKADKKKQEKQKKRKEPEAEEVQIVDLRLENDSELLSNLGHYPGWLVEGFWTRKSHGIISGEPKSFKSTLVLDLAISIASGKPFLGKFDVIEKGPVLIVQNENAGWIMKDRATKIRSSKKLMGEVTVKKGKIAVKWPPELPIYYLNQQGFSFSDPAQRELIEQIIEKIHPKLVVFDPLYLMFEGDISSSKDLSPILNWLLTVKETHNTSIILIHHWKKNTQGTNIRAGQRMLGSTTLHGWVESAWYIEVQGSQNDDEGDIEKSKEMGQEHQDAESNEAMAEELNTPGANVNLTLEREFRGAGTYPKMDLTINMGNFGEMKYNVTINKHVPRAKKKTKASRADLKDEIMHILALHRGEIPIRTIAESLGISKRKAKDLYEEIMSQRDQKLPEVIEE